MLLGYRIKNSSVVLVVAAAAAVSLVDRNANCVSDSESGDEGMTQASVNVDCRDNVAVRPTTTTNILVIMVDVYSMKTCKYWQQRLWGKEKESTVLPTKTEQLMLRQILLSVKFLVQNFLFSAHNLRDANKLRAKKARKKNETTTQAGIYDGINSICATIAATAALLE